MNNQPAEPSSRWVVILITVVCILTIGVLSTFGEILSIVASNRNEMWSTLKKIQEDTIARRVAVSDVISHMQALHLPPCSREFRRAAQSYIVGSALIEDIVTLGHSHSITCSALYDTNIYDIADKGTVARFRATNQNHQITLQRDLRFKIKPSRTFSLYNSGNIGVLVLSYRLPDIADQSYHSLSIFDISSSDQRARTFFGPRLAIPIRQLVNGREYWTGGIYLITSCTPDGSICGVAVTSLSGLLRARMSSIALFAFVGMLFGGLVSIRILICLRRRRSVGERLRRALRQETLYMLYQPITDFERGVIVGVEALMRWPIQGNSMMTPDVFIPAAERNNLIHDITSLAVRLVGRDMRDLMVQRRDLTVSINIVISDLAQPHFHQDIEECLVDAGILPSQIAFEITERTDADLAVVIENIMHLKDRGFRFYIDDFGTGYSSIAYLADIPVNAIKIDKSFTQTVGTDAARAKLVEPMLQMIRNIGIPIIVEGVENDTQRDFFRAHGAPVMQGWLTGKPITAAAVADLVGLGCS